MCGIAGLLHFDPHRPIRPDELTRMAERLAHRGPDDSGIYIDPNYPAGLASRRLSIIDLDHGHQPQANEDQSVWVVFNGEIYNFAEIRRELISAGHVFSTGSDTEVLVHLWEERGPGCLEALRGMFALAIWDRRQKQLFLARDRLGKKPLYYAIHDGRLLFASECKALLATENFPRQPDIAQIANYLLLGYVPPDASAFAGVRQVPPAHYLLVDACGLGVSPKISSAFDTRPDGRGYNRGQDAHATVQPRRYWSLPVEPSFRGSIKDAAEAVREQLTEAVRLRLVSDVPLGAFLSGGIDSTVVVGLMSSLQERPVTTCSIGFDEKKYNELPYARIAAERFRCDHHEFMVRADSTAAVEKLSYFYDEPFADSSALPTWYLCQLARQQVTVALTGDGGDECFAGYQRYRAMQLAQRLHGMKWLNFLFRGKKIRSGEYRSARRYLARFLLGIGREPAQRYLQWTALLNPDLLTPLLGPDSGNHFYPDRAWEIYEPYFNTDRAPTPAQVATRAAWADAHLYLPGDLNTKTDRASMSIGLELRSPFQDHKLMELAYSLPWEYRLNHGIRKYVLRQACRDLIPPVINRRGKAGFGVPVGRWFRGELRPLFNDVVLSPTTRQRAIINFDELDRLLAEHDQHRWDHGHLFWALLMLELWFRRYIDQKS